MWFRVRNSLISARDKRIMAWEDSMRSRSLLTVFFILLAPALFGQQTYVTRYDVFAGYAFLDSPHIGLAEHGVQMQFGVRPRRWYSIGFDYSYSRGDLTITPDLLPDALQTTLRG